MAKEGVLRRHHGAQSLEESSYIDLGAMTFPDQELALGSKGTVRMVEVLRSDDIHAFAKLAYQGDFVILDYTSIANDQLAVRQMNRELKDICHDIGGDVAGIAKDLLCLTPAGFRIDRQKLRPSL